MSIQYASDVFKTIEHKTDNCRPYGQSPEGYGRKIAMPYRVRLNERGPWRRVYCCIFSNVGTCYIVVRGAEYIIRDGDVGR